MNAALQKICEQFIVNRDTIKNTLRLGSAYVYPQCANLFCSRNMQADEEQLRACQQILKERTGAFSSFRGVMQLPAICLLAMEQNPELKMEQAIQAYETARQQFSFSNQLALAVFFMPSDINMNQTAARAKELHRRMKKDHPFLTSAEDSVVAMMMACVPRTDDQLLEDLESCYQLLKERFGASNHVQTAAQVLALAAGDPCQKTQHFLDLYDAIGQFGGKYGKYSELAPLAALSLMSENVRQTASEIMDADAFLDKQKGYGFWGMGKKMRLMHAAMLVSDLYVLNNTASAQTQDTVTIMMIAQCLATSSIIIASNAAIAAAT